jgi:F-type H+-transporting ATPase subunit delta
VSSKAEPTRIAKRYARAGFLWAEENKKLPALEKDIAAFAEILGTVPEMTVLLETPLMSRAAQGSVMADLCKKAKISDALSRIIGTAAENRRLDCLPAILSALRGMIAEHKGELTVDVVSATALTAQQTKKISEILKGQFGRAVELRVTQDSELIGGIVIRAGSLMIDGSVRTQLDKLTRVLKNSDVVYEQEKTMKEVA